jgi:protein subunit release factor A
MQVLLLPKDPNDAKSVVLEIFKDAGSSGLAVVGSEPSVV